MLVSLRESPGIPAHDPLRRGGQRRPGREPSASPSPLTRRRWEAALTIPADPQFGHLDVGDFRLGPRHRPIRRPGLPGLHEHRAGGSNETHIYERYSANSGANLERCRAGRQRGSDIGSTVLDDAFLPAAAVDPATGDLAVAWYDTRYDSAKVNGPGLRGPEQQWGLYASRETFAISPGASNAADAGIDGFGRANGYGADMGLSFVCGVLGAAWADNSLELGGNPTLPNFNIAAGGVDVANGDRASAAGRHGGCRSAATEGSPFSGSGGHVYRCQCRAARQPISRPPSTGATATSPTAAPASRLPATRTITSSSAAATSTPWRAAISSRSRFTTTSITWLGPRPAMSARCPAGQSEPSIAVDTSGDPSQPRLFAVSNEEGTGLFAATSSDGGVTWTGRTIADGGDGLPRGIVRSQGGLRQVRQPLPDLPGQERATDVVVALSTDGGQSFATLDTFSNAGGVVDQPSVTTGPGVGGTGQRGVGDVRANRGTSWKSSPRTPA